MVSTTGPCGAVGFGFWISFFWVGGDPFRVKSGSPRSAEFSCCACRCFLVLIFMRFLFNLFTKGFCLVQAHLTFRGPVLRCGSGGDLAILTLVIV